jgi:hypothetical protein
MVLLEHLSGVDITRNHVASLRSEPSAVVIGGDARCVTLTTEPFVQPGLTVENDPGRNAPRRALHSLSGCYLEFRREWQLTCRAGFLALSARMRVALRMATLPASRA